MKKQKDNLAKVLIIIVTTGTMIAWIIFLIKVQASFKNKDLAKYKICQGSECWYTNQFEKTSSTITLNPTDIWGTNWGGTTVIWGKTYSITYGNF